MSLQLVFNPFTGTFDYVNAADGLTFTANCEAAASIGDAVVFVGSNLVGTADPTTLSRMPAVGVLIQKTTPTTCVVARGGPVGGYSGIVPGARYSVGLDGRPMVGRVHGTEASPVFVQPLGVGVDSSRVEVIIGGFARVVT